MNPRNEGTWYKISLNQSLIQTSAQKCPRRVVEKSTTYKIPEFLGFHTFMLTSL